MQSQPELLWAFRAGQPDALGTVYKRYRERVRRLVRAGFTTPGPPPVRVPGLPDEADQADAVHEVFVRAFRKTARIAYDGERPYEPYLLRIAKNLRIDQCRRSGRVLLPEHGDVSEVSHFTEQPDAQARVSPEEEAEWRQLSDLTNRYLATQDEQTQRFAELRFRRELSQAEVATQMNVTRRRVRSLEAEVLRGLRLFLEKKAQR